MAESLYIWLALLLSTSLAAGEDRVTYSAGKDGRGRATIAGTVVDYTGQHLLMRSAGGGEQPIPTARILAIESSWHPQQVVAEQRLAEGQYAEALDAYSQALREESRVWVQRQILAECIRCLVASGRTEQAGEAFLRLVRSDPLTRHFGRIPLSWQAHSPSTGLEQKALAWMQDTSEAARLMGASWLLSTRHGHQAVEVLRVLAARAEPRIAGLAEAQLWRTRLGAADDAELGRWRALIEKMPVPVRAGAYYTLGQGLAARGHSQQAALALMRVPILYAEEDRVLVAAALLTAGGQLEKIGQGGEAAALYWEILRDSANTPAAGQAAARLECLGSGNNE